MYHEQLRDTCVSQQSDYRTLINAVAFREDRVSTSGDGGGGNGKIEFRADRKYEVQEERGPVPHDRMVDRWICSRE